MYVHVCILDLHTFKSLCPSVSVCLSGGLCAPKLSVLYVHTFPWLSPSLDVVRCYV